MNDENPSDDVIEAREEYAMMALLLFYPFRTQSDLVESGSFWKKYISSVRDGSFWPKGLDILQNIQDIHYNCSQMEKPVDPITASTILKAHEKDKELNRSNEQEDNTVNVDQIENLLDSLNGCEPGQQISDPDIDKRRLAHIAEGVTIPPHTITNNTSPSTLKNILDIPASVARQFQDDMTTDENVSGLDLQNDCTYLRRNPMIIEMITGKYLNHTQILTGKVNIHYKKIALLAASIWRLLSRLTPWT